jgi:hypothetical protein
MQISDQGQCLVVRIDEITYLVVVLSVLVLYLQLQKLWSSKPWILVLLFHHLNYNNAAVSPYNVFNANRDGCYQIHALASLHSSSR